ncbi:MAG: family 43 glycosylhydrolase [Deltaproteobacteria bacterium]|nr:family 43 glycosylhydrolase [Deltaproteobacteria bacterium]
MRNPIITHMFTADPSARVFDDRIYVYASHDLDAQDEYEMTDYHVFSSNDLVNWQDHGVALDVADIPWADRLFAPDATYCSKTQKYYLYFPNGGDSIGVAVSDTPYGPFRDALGKPLIERSTPGVEDVEWVFDPACFVDDDGQAYLYFGGGMPGTGENARVIRLKEDMISLADESAATIHAPDFFEASFMHKKNDTYYFSYSTTFAAHPPTIDYLISQNPLHGFVHAGTLLPNPMQNQNNNNHHSVVQYHGQWYVFYHNRVLSEKYGYSEFQRSITLDKIEYDSSGNMKRVNAQPGSVRQLRSLNAYTRLEAESFADQRGISVTPVIQNDRRTGMAVSDIHTGDWIGYSQVDFGSGATRVQMAVAGDASDGFEIEVYADGCDRFIELQGRRLGACIGSGNTQPMQWSNLSCALEPISGVHDIYLRFKGAAKESRMRMDYFQFE